MPRKTPLALDAAAFRATVSEDQMEAQIRALLAREPGAACYHLRNSAKAPEMVDFPDLILILPSRQLVLAIELKSQARAVTAGQADLMARMEQCTTFVAGIVRPEPHPGELRYDDLLSWLEEEPDV